jgi:hypothetical protein
LLSAGYAEQLMAAHRPQPSSGDDPRTAPRRKSAGR